MSAVPELTPTEICIRWPDTSRSDELVILDVRESAELQVASLEGALHIPMNSVPQRLQELDSDKPLAVLCHHGSRARQVAAYLLASGRDNIFNVLGGIDAWSQEVDPKIPRY